MLARLDLEMPCEHVLNSRAWLLLVLWMYLPERVLLIAGLDMDGELQVPDDDFVSGVEEMEQEARDDVKDHAVDSVTSAQPEDQDAVSIALDPCLHLCWHHLSRTSG